MKFKFKEALIQKKSNEQRSDGGEKMVSLMAIAGNKWRMNELLNLIEGENFK